MNAIERIITWIPSYAEDSVLFKEIVEAYAVELEKIGFSLNEIYEQLFIKKSTWRLSIWERDLGIHPKPDATFKERRMEVLSKIPLPGKVGGKELEECIFLATGHTSKVKLEGQPAFIHVQIFCKNGLYNFLNTLYAIENLKPAHLGCITAFGHFHNLFIGMAKRSRRTETHFPKERKTVFDSFLSVGMFKRQVKKMDCFVALEELTDKTFGMNVFVGGYLGGKVVRKEF